MKTAQQRNTADRYAPVDFFVRREQKKKTVPADYGGEFREHYIPNYWYRRDKSLFD
jgi:hypothetical protein